MLTNDEHKFITDALKKIQDKDTNNFDLVTAVFTILNTMMQFTMNNFNNQTLIGWKNDSNLEPGFLRFSSLLKKFLEENLEIYLKDITTKALNIPNDILSEKIKSAESKINEISKDKESILSKGKPLFEKESELRNQIAQLRELKTKLAELEVIEEELKKHDLNALEKEYKDKSSKLAELEGKIKPLLAEIEAKKTDIEAKQEEIKTLQDYFQKLESDIKQLLTLSGIEADKLCSSISQWIEEIKERKIIRIQKRETILEEFDKELKELKDIENQITEQLKKLNELTTAIMKNQSAYERHFKANERLANSFSKTLGNKGIKEIDSISAEIHQKLVEFDKLLKDANKQIQEISKTFEITGF